MGVLCEKAEDIKVFVSDEINKFQKVKSKE